MVKDLFFNKKAIALFLFIMNVVVTNAQIIEEDKGFSFGLESLVLSPYNESINSSDDTDVELNYDSFIWGASLFTNYHFSSLFFGNISLGVDYLNQPHFVYYPLTFGVGLTPMNSKEGFLVQANMGTHLGDLDKNGFLFRGKFGYGIRFLKQMIFNIGLLYSFQNLNKTFDNSMRADNYYNIESLGLFLNIQWNSIKNK